MDLGSGRGTRPAPWIAVPDQCGRRFVITGGSAGLGLETARILVSRGAEVVLAVRSLDKGESAARELEVRARRGGVAHVRRLDVADLASVREFAADLGPIDVLINNAGVMGVPFELTPEGVDLQLATNHLGHFALTNLLLPQVTDRVVGLGSATHRGATLDLEDLDWRRRGYQPFAAYGQSKLAVLLSVAELQRRLTASGSRVRATAAHPGATATGITGSSGHAWVTRIGAFGHALVGMPVWRGALTTVYAATMDVPGNTYIGPDGPREMQGWPVSVGRSRLASDPDLAKALWARSEELAGVDFPL